MNNTKKSLTLCFLAFSCMFTNAQNVELKNLQYRGPIDVTTPWMNGNVDVNEKEYKLTSILESPINIGRIQASKGDTMMIVGSEKTQLHALSFPLINTHFADVSLNVKGIKDYKIYVNNKLTGNSLKLKPGKHDILIKFLTKAGERDTIYLSLDSPQAKYLSGGSGNLKRPFTLDDVMYAEHIDNARISPSGQYAVVSYSQSNKNGKTDRNYKLITVKDGKTLAILPSNWSWMENEDLLWYIKTGSGDQRNIMVVNPVTFEEKVFAENIPDGNFRISPDKKFLIYFTYQEGPKEDRQIYRVINPEDRQQGYRDRSGLAFYDLTTGVYHPLTFGNKNIMLQDVSSDGNKLLIMDMRNRFEKRPTSVFSLYEMNLKDMKVDTLVFEDGFISGAKYSSDGKKIVIAGSPESLGGIGKNVPEGRVPNMTDGQLFIMDIATKEIDPITKDFNPAVGGFMWHKPSGNIFFTAEDRDLKPLFQYDTKTGKITKMPIPEDIIKVYSLASNANEGIITGESASNPDIMYSISFKKGLPISRKLDAVGEKMLEEVDLATVESWDFVNSRGDTINGRFYLPPNFDPQKKYPLIVNYYGGCSPTSRNFATRYPHHVYANNGYIVYVINPSGATGFGQEFSSRHVSTAGEGVAQDIIEGTQQFIDQHPFVNKDKIGCIGASYGGFMTQYLQTVTDMFAAAISHAGISDHTSYWGNGYWGYSYSEVSMGEDYPWSNPDLYVKQSPLYNADKINTPILFLHGDVDTNVPPAESIQLFTALKLLGKDTALVEVADQNHHILDQEKRQKWQDTIFAWFAKYLQDDPTWWNELYPPTSL